MQKAHSKWKGQSGENDRYVVAMLPREDGISPQSHRVFVIYVTRTYEEPSAVTVPESPLRVVGIIILVTSRMMADVIGSPFESGVL